MNASIAHPLIALAQESLRLIDILLRERQALADNDMPALTATLGIKEEKLQLLMRLELSFRENLSREGFTPDRPGVQIWLERHRLSSKPWQLLNITLALLRDLNSINGNIVSRSQRTTQRVLEILSGQVNNHSTYQPNGLHSNMKLTRALGKA